MKIIKTNSFLQVERNTKNDDEKLHILSFRLSVFINIINL